MSYVSDFANLIAYHFLCECNFGLLIVYISSCYFTPFIYNYSRCVITVVFVRT